MEQKEECHHVQVKIHHHHEPKQQYNKWKRSDDGEDSGVDMSDEDESGEEAVEMPDAEEIEGEGEDAEGEVVEAEGSERKKRFFADAGLGAVVGGHIGKKLGLGVGLAIGLGSKKIALKKLQDGGLKKKVKAAPVHIKKAHKQHFKTEKVCKHVPFEQCTSNRVCEQVPKQRCVSVPHEVCVNVSISNLIRFRIFVDMFDLVLTGPRDEVLERAF